MRTPSPPYCRLDLAPPLADRFIGGVAPIDYGPVLLLMPFGFHLAMDTLPSADPTLFRGQRFVTPAFGYGTPHLSARGTSTLLNSALLSARYYGAVRLLQHLHVRRSVSGLHGPAFAYSRRHAGDLPVLGRVGSWR